ncbi:MAG: hypothetical protein ACUVRZ_01840 [Desulfobacca sp.]|uniref:hypothetical protein n=1 Tax=Desulfobacca sp. TaxID=2067990 RepID=UPI00404B9D7E
MTQDQGPAVATELTERLRQIVNEILAMFNEQNVTPQEAGTVILALIHRLMGVLRENQEMQRAFVASIIDVVNQHLLQVLEESDSPPCRL